MSTRRHEPGIRGFGSDHRILDRRFAFGCASGIETDGGGLLVVVAGDAAIAGLSGPQRAIGPDCLDILPLAQG